VAIDIPAVGVAGQGIKYARAAWDVSRDGGGPGSISIPSQQVPAGALILGIAYQVVDTFTDTGTSTIVVYVDGATLASGIDPVMTPRAIVLANDAITAPPVAAYPITITVSGDGYSAGSAYIYVVYV